MLRSLGLGTDGEQNTGDCFDNGEFEPKLNLDLFCLEWRVDVGTFFCVLRVVSVGSLWENLWNLLLHLHGAKMSELSLITLDLSVLIRCRISILSTIQSLQLAVHADFMHWMGFLFFGGTFIFATQRCIEL